MYWQFNALKEGHFVQDCPSIAVRSTVPGLEGIIDHGFEYQSVADTGRTSEAEHVHSSERRIVATQTTKKTKQDKKHIH